MKDGGVSFVVKHAAALEKASGWRQDRGESETDGWKSHGETERRTEGAKQIARELSRREYTWLREHLR